MEGRKRLKYSTLESRESEQRVRESEERRSLLYDDTLYVSKYKEQVSLLYQICN